MNEAQLKETLLDNLQKVAPEADLDDLEPDENIQEALEIDSYDFLMFLISLDESLGIEVPEADYDKVTTLDDLVHYMTVKLA